MLIRKKYIVFLLVFALLISVLSLIDLHRQQDLAEKYARKQIARILSMETTLNNWELPKTLLGIKPTRVDTNYALSQWEIVFSIEEKGFIQMFVTPSNYLIIPILNFEDDFEIDRINFEQSY